MFLRIVFFIILSFSNFIVYALEAKFNITPVSGTAPIRLFLDATISDGKIVKYIWTCEAPSRIIGVLPRPVSSIYATQNGLYKFTLTVTDDTNNTATITKTIMIGNGSIPNSNENQINNKANANEPNQWHAEYTIEEPNNTETPENKTENQSNHSIACPYSFNNENDSNVKSICKNSQGKIILVVVADSNGGKHFCRFDNKTHVTNLSDIKEEFTCTDR